MCVASADICSHSGTSACRRAGVRWPGVSGAPALPGFLAALAPALQHYGYLAVAGLVLVEDFGVPAPGETILIAAAVYAGAGRLNILAVAVIAFLAAVVGDNIGYAIGHYGGRRLVERVGRYVLLTPARLVRAEQFFARHGGKIVTLARFIDGLRQANGIIAGITGMRWRKFLVYNALGAGLWVATWTSLGDLAGAHLTAFYDTARGYETYLLIGLGAIVVAFLGWHITRRRARQKASPDTTTKQDQPPPASTESAAGKRSRPPHS